MKAFVLVKNGKPEVAFELQELPNPEPQPHEVVVETECFGLNFADIMARNGLYQDCPPLPTVIGYESVGKVVKLGKDVNSVAVGQRVVAFSRFGGYATHVTTDQRAVSPIPDDMDAGKACAFATQYCTAYYAAAEMTNLHEGDHVLIDAAAGGVGTALVQLAKRKNCIIYGGAGSDEKLKTTGRSVSNQLSEERFF
jgi:NADPH:quinone reductase-like Zn-dependent oxidoreductase